MNIYYTKGFKELINNPLYHIEISKFRLGNLGEEQTIGGRDRILSTEDFYNLNYDFLKKHSIVLAPSGTDYDDYYDLETILDDSSLTLSMEIPRTNVSMINVHYPYNTIFVIYKNLLDNKEDIAFILSNIKNYEEKDKYKLTPLSLETDRNIINIPRFTYSCTIDFNSSEDVKFLEGSGLSEPRALRELEINSRELEIYDPKEKRYVSVVSYESYLQEIRSQDDLDHLDSAFINKFGLKIY